MPLSATESIKLLTPSQRQCILDLSGEWKESGYNKVHADILYALGDSDLYGQMGELVDCDFHAQEGRGHVYRHRLLPQGLEIQSHLQTISELV